MIQLQSLETLDRLVSRLPFHLDDFDQANRLFDTWRAGGPPDDKKYIDLWTYCFVWRNVLVKFARDPDLNPSDFDFLVAHIYERVVNERHKIREEGRYASWISVVCRNQFINHVRAGKKNIRFEEEESNRFECIAEPRWPASDHALLFQVLHGALARLPGYLQEIAHLRFIEERSYYEISEMTGKKVGVLRSYVHKALQRLREDRQLRVFIAKEFREDMKNEGM